MAYHYMKNLLTMNMSNCEYRIGESGRLHYENRIQDPTCQNLKLLIKFLLLTNDGHYITNSTTKYSNRNMIYGSLMSHNKTSSRLSNSITLVYSLETSDSVSYYDLERRYDDY